MAGIGQIGIGLWRNRGGSLASRIAGICGPSNPILGFWDANRTDLQTLSGSNVTSALSSVPYLGTPLALVPHGAASTGMQLVAGASLNGGYAWYFNGSNLCQRCDTLGTFAGSGAGITLFRIVRAATPINSMRYYGFGKAGDAAKFIECVHDATSVRRMSVTGYAVYGETLDTDWHCMVEAHDGSTCACVNDGGSDADEWAFVSAAAYDQFALGAYIRNGTAGSYQRYQMEALLAVSGKLSQSKMHQIVGLLRGQYGYQHTPTQIVHDGNSLSIQADAWPYTIVDALPDWYVYDIAVSGQTDAQMLADFETQVPPLMPEYASKKIYSFWGLINSIKDDIDASTIMATYWAIADAAKAHGYTVVVGNCMACGVLTAPQIAVRTAVNSTIASEWSAHADALVDLTAPAELQNPADPTYFNADQTHLVAAGYAVVGGLWATALAGL